MLLLARWPQVTPKFRNSCPKLLQFYKTFLVKENKKDRVDSFIIKLQKIVGNLLAWLDELQKLYVNGMVI